MKTQGLSVGSDGQFCDLTQIPVKSAHKTGLFAVNSGAQRKQGAERYNLRNLQIK